MESKLGSIGKKKLLGQAWGGWMLRVVKCQNLSPCQTQPRTQETIATASLCIEEL